MKIFTVKIRTQFGTTCLVPVTEATEARAKKKVSRLSSERALEIAYNYYLVEKKELPAIMKKYRNRQNYTNLYASAQAAVLQAAEQYKGAEQEFNSFARPFIDEVLGYSGSLFRMTA